MPGPRLPAALCALVLWALPARAHEYWLAPSSYRAARLDTLEVRAFAGTGFRGEAKPYAGPRVVALTLRAARDIDVAGAAVNGDLVFARFVAGDEGGAVVGYESNFTAIELPREEFDAYLRLEGLDRPLEARARLGAAGPGRERYGRCAKTWVAGRDPSRITRPLGLALELVPLGDPGAGPRLAVRLLDRGRPLAGALVRAWNRPLDHGLSPRDAAGRDSVGPAAEARTGRDGVATLDVSRPGEWLLSAVHMTPSEDRAAADWQSRWASLTFARESRPR